ncbi:L,D-transpeptidase [Priestia endophytica]|uniref:L,D-transpeptidase n=1 Tax=Priestia endophytica TaxID=135735 RepID=UPI0022817F3C|nr:L,D-transpeptidase [Priestia endophytica]
MFKKGFILFILVFLVFFSVEGITSSAAGSKFIIVNKANNQLAYYENSHLKRVFKVGTGRTPSLTREGTFKIVNKIVNRPLTIRETSQRAIQEIHLGTDGLV